MYRTAYRTVSRTGRGLLAGVWLTIASSCSCSYASGEKYKTIDMERCKACGDGVSISSTRRTLESDSRNALLSISRTIDFPEATVHFGSGYICTKCFRLAQRYERLKSELENVEEILKDKLQFVCANHVGEVSRATKRPSSCEAIPRRKKSRVETSEGAVMVSGH